MRPIVARDLMSPDVLTVRDDLSANHLAGFFREHQITGAPVEDQEGRVVGVVSLVDLANFDAGGREQDSDPVPSGDLVHGWTPEIGDDGIRIYHVRDEEVRVRDIMTAELYAVGEDAEVPEIATKLLNHHIHRLLVIEDDELVGVISTSDLLGLLLEEE